MPKDPKRNIQNYQLQGGHLNEFEYQKNQGEMAGESELPLTNESDKANQTEARRLAEVATKSHRKVEKRKRLGIVKAGAQKKTAARKKSSKKTARKPTKKTTTGAGTRKRTGVKRSRQRSAANR